MIKRTLTFANRTAKEILRDPLTLLFGLGFPVVLLLLMSAMQANVPVPIFEIASLTPGIAVFGLSFITLFTATLIARDRESALLRRLYTTPLTAWNVLLGYSLPLLPIALLQSVICYILAWCLGLDLDLRMLYALGLSIPTALLYIAIGLLCGSVLNVKQVGGLCGALLTNLAAWLSGAWFDLDLVGVTFRKIAYALPFVHAVELQRATLACDSAAILSHLPWVLGYAILLGTIAVFLFLKQMKK